MLLLYNHELIEATIFSWLVISIFYSILLDCTFSTIFYCCCCQVMQVARNYFGCSDLPYVPLENNGGRGSARYSALQ